MRWKSIYAFFNLTVHLVLRFVRRITLQKSPGLADFLENYRDDRIVPLSAAEVQLLPDFSRCLSCGLCDSLCPILPGVTGGQRFGPSFLSSLARSIPDFAAVSIDLTPCGDCRGCEAICPEGVPLKKIASFIKSKKSSLESPPDAPQRP